MRLIKLPTGQQNVPYIVLKPNYAIGVRRPRRTKRAKVASAFNSPSITIVLRKAA